MHVHVNISDRWFQHNPENFRLQVRREGFKVRVSLFHESYWGDDWEMAQFALSEEVAEWLGWQLLTAAEGTAPASGVIGDVEHDRTVTEVPQLRKRRDEAAGPTGVDPQAGEGLGIIQTE